MRLLSRSGLLVLGTLSLEACGSDGNDTTALPNGMAGDVSGGGQAGMSGEGTATSGAGMGGSTASGGAATAGSGGEDAAGGSMEMPEMRSAGCGTPAAFETEQYERFTWDQNGTEREYFVRLPANYEPDRAYPTAFLWTGCTGNGENGVPLFRADGAELIAVGPTPPGECFEASPGSIDEEFFDAMLEAVTAAFCVDEARVFTAGHSSGSWMSNVLGCTRADVLRAQGNISGGLPGGVNRVECAGNIAGILIHDNMDFENEIQGGINARDRLIEQNGCSQETVALEREPCVEYQGCTEGYPVVWCETSGNGHSRQDDLTIPAIWEFFSRF